MLLITPIQTGADPEHQGCVALTIDDIDQAQIRRDADGRIAPRAIFTADGNGLGPGLCTYDPNSETGVLIVIPSFDLSTTSLDIEFSLRATNVHP